MTPRPGNVTITTVIGFMLRLYSKTVAFVNDTDES